MNALRSLIAPGALAVVALACAPVSAGTIWDGGGANDNWTTGANWNAIGLAQTAPPNNGTADIHMAGTTRRTPLLNVPYSINSLTFDKGAAAFVLLGAQQLTIGAGGVRTNDADMQTVIGPIRLAADQTWTAAAGRLQMDQVNLNGFDLAFGGVGLIDMIGVIHGAGDLILPRHYKSTVTMVGMSNGYVGATKVFGGTLALLGSGVAVPGDLTIASGTVRLAGNEKISQAAGVDVTVGGDGLLDVNTRTETLANLLLTGGGRVTVGTGGKLSVGEAVVTGLGSSLDAEDGALYVGEVGAGMLDILDRGEVKSGLAYVGYGIGSTGEVTVSGDDSIWDAIPHIGYQGSGVLNITAGGAVSGVGHIGDVAGSTGVVNVDGVGVDLVGSTLGGVGAVGYNGTGFLNVTGGGTASGVGYLGFGAGSTGTVNVDGVGSTLDGVGVVGYNGTGILNVTNDGDVTSDQTIIGYYADSVGNVHVDGLGSSWYSSHDIHVFKGELAVTDQAIVVSALPMLINSQGILSGNGAIGSDVTSRGLVAPGPATGALSIDGYYTQQPTGVLEIEIGGVDDFDQLLGNPANYIVTLDGTLEVKLIDGFTPLIGQTFTIVSAYDVDGMFSTLLLPDMPFRRFEVIYNPQSVVLEVVFDFGAGAAARSVPEPGALALIAAAPLFLACARRKRPRWVR